MQAAPSPQVIEEAIRWMVTLQSGHASPEDYEACERWQEAHPLHQLAWDRLGQLDQQVRQIPAPLARATLHDERRMSQRMNNMLQRRQVLKLAVLVGGSAGLLGLGYQKLPWRPMLADYTTAVGESRHVALMDATDIHLNTASALDVDYDASVRLLRFYQGEILLTTGHQQAFAQHNFIVETSHGQIRALGTRFLVRDHENGILVSVFDGAVEVAAGWGKRIVQAGYSLVFSRQQLGPLLEASRDSLAWLNGVIVARNMKLISLLQELERYRHGTIRCGAEVAELRISGVFPVHDIDKALDAVADTLGLEIKRSWFYRTLLDRVR